MTNEIRNIATITEYNDLLGVETLHPLVSVINLSELKPMRHLRHTFGFYAIFLKDTTACGALMYGRQTYDYQKGTIVCIAPGQVAGSDDNGEVFQPKGWALLFHPDLIYGTHLGRNIREYTYFSYEVNEALHISDRERAVFLDCLEKIQQELEHSIDRLSKRLISTNIELLLDYCLRFYERQFITREEVNKDIVTRFDQLLDSYFDGKEAEKNGLPTVKYCAEKLFLSPNYFGDLIKKETGRTAQEFIQNKVVDIAKQQIFDPKKSISQISFELGFRYPQHFTRMFKKVAGRTPAEYRGK